MVSPLVLAKKLLMTPTAVNTTTTRDRISIIKSTSQCFFPETGARGLKKFLLNTESMYNIDKDKKVIW